MASSLYSQKRKYLYVASSNAFSGRKFVVQTELRDVGNNNEDIYSTRMQ